MGFKKYRWATKPIDIKMEKLIIDFGRERNIIKRNGNVNFRAASKEFAESVEEMKWRYLRLKNLR